MSAGIEELRAGIDRTRGELGETVQELVSRADLPARGRRKAAQVGGRLRGAARRTAQRSRRHPKAAAVIGAAAGGAAAAAVRRRRISRADTGPVQAAVRAGRLLAFRLQAFRRGGPVGPVGPAAAWQRAAARAGFGGPVRSRFGGPVRSGARYAVRQRARAVAGWGRLAAGRPVRGTAALAWARNRLPSGLL